MADDTSTQLASNLKLLREEAGLSQKALAEVSGVPRPTIAHLESGQANPTLAVVLKVATALGATVDGLVSVAQAPLQVFSSRALPTERTSRLRRVRVLSGGSLRDPEIERITVKAQSRVHFAATAKSPHFLLCERGDFVLMSGSQELALGAEKVAHLRDDCDCFSKEGGVLYHVFGN